MSGGACLLSLDWLTVGDRKHWNQNKNKWTSRSSSVLVELERIGLFSFDAVKLSIQETSAYLLTINIRPPHSRASKQINSDKIFRKIKIAAGYARRAGLVNRCASWDREIQREKKCTNWLKYVRNPWMSSYDIERRDNLTREDDILLFTCIYLWFYCLVSYLSAVPCTSWFDEWKRQ